MGTSCGRIINIGEDYVITLMTNIKANKIFYVDLYHFVESNKQEFTYKEAKELIENSLIDSKELKDETLKLLEPFENSNTMLLFKDFESFAREKLCETEDNNKHLLCQIHVLRKLFSKQYEFNCYHFLLTMLSFLNDQKKDKIKIFFEICSKIKKHFTFDDFKLFFYSYLYNNLFTTSASALILISADNNIMTELDHLVSYYFTDINIKKYEDSIIEDFLNKNNVLPGSHIMKNKEFHEIFFDKEYIFNFKELRNSYLTLFR